MKRHLLAGAALGVILFGWTNAMAAEAAADAVETGAVEELVVFGRGEARQVQTVDGSDLQLEVAGASPLKMVEKLPNVNLQSADPFGAYEWSSRISIRGFDRNRLGFTLDEVPLGDMTYGNHNGLHISRAIAGENVGQATLAQGAGALGVASVSDLGGSLQFRSREPSAEFAVLAAATAGSDDTYRGFVRLDSGELATGARGYLSYSYNTAGKWKGEGTQRQTQVNFKAVQPIGEGSLTGWVNWSTRQENDYQDLSLEMISRLGLNWDIPALVALGFAGGLVRGWRRGLGKLNGHEQEREQLQLLLKLPLQRSPVDCAVTAVPGADKVRRLSERSAA